MTSLARGRCMPPHGAARLGGMERAASGLPSRIAVGGGTADTHARRGMNTPQPEREPVCGDYWGLRPYPDGFSPALGGGPAITSCDQDPSTSPEEISRRRRGHYHRIVGGRSSFWRGICPARLSRLRGLARRANTYRPGSVSQGRIVSHRAGRHRCAASRPALDESSDPSCRHPAGDPAGTF